MIIAIYDIFTEYIETHGISNGDFTVHDLDFFVLGLEEDELGDIFRFKEILIFLNIVNFPKELRKMGIEKLLK